MNLPGYGELVQCPYDKAHQLAKTRVQTHLIKCRKNFPKAEKVQCPFNVTHVINKPELAIHVEDCPDRASFDRYKYTAQVSTAAVKRPEPVAVGADYSCLDSEENWDDTNEPTYNPQEYVQNANVIRTLNLAAPSQRAAFRDQEIARLNRLQSKTGGHGSDVVHHQYR